MKDPVFISVSITLRDDRQISLHPPGLGYVLIDWQAVEAGYPGQVVVISRWEKRD